ncbi:zinc finger MYM-type protein 1-like [Acyrthosiphon pisum]|uniref:Zinc finger MYM-type protein 1-like n=1 Tax=Acyrthosiphon pisum TaxID=7029 RepID=A0A8R2NTJ8_ACYPI|nr:zinc finger MYM-type protein 1-like [Acyrthosiphon pisum]
MEQKKEALENNSVAEIDTDDPPVLPEVQKLPSESIDIGDINTGPIRPKLQISGSISKTSKFNSKSKLEIHATTKQHLINSEKWASYTQNIKSGSVHTQTASAYREKVLKNRAYIKNLIDIVLYLGRQGLAFRAHNEEKTSINQGNFKEACVLLSKCNEDFSTIFNEKTNYTSWSIQNDLINISAQMIKNTIVNELIESGFFSVMCDEARCFRQEQMSICVRYTKNLKVYERFLGFIDVSENQNADALATAMISFFEINKINVPIVAQAYDGANVMSGKFNGVQQKIKSKYPYAVYTHCMAHRINLIVLDMCKLVKDTRIVFNCLETLYVYFSHPGNDAKFTEIQVKLGIKKTSLTRLSDTRWNCRVRNCVAVKLNFKAIVTLLNDEINSSTNKDVVQAMGIMTIITKPSFIVNLIILEEVLQIINILSTQLQKKDATLGSAVTLIEGVIKTFESLRTEVEFHNIWEKIINFTKINNIIPDFLGPNSKTSKRQRQSTSNLEDFHVFATTSSEQQNQNEFNQYTESYWRTHYYQIIDTLIIHFNKRFSSNSLELATSIDYFHKMNYYESQCFIEQYKDLLNVDVNTLQSEMLVVKNCVSRRNPSFTLEDIKLIMDAELYPNLYKLLSLSLTIPISSATCERSFSAMRKIKNWLRTSMNQDRFTNLSLIYIERDLSNELSNEKI